MFLIYYSRREAPASANIDSRSTLAQSLEIMLGSVMQHATAAHMPLTTLRRRSLSELERVACVKFNADDFDYQVRARE